MATAGLLEHADVAGIDSSAAAAAMQQLPVLVQLEHGL
jgi:hypothetical protein